MKMLSMIGLSFTAAMALVAAPALAEKNVDSLLKAHIKAIGGMDAVNKIKTIKRSGSAEMDGMLGQMSGSQEEVIVVGKKIYQKLDLSVFTETSAWNGKTGWSENSMEGSQDVKGDDLEFMQMQADVNGLIPLWRQYGSAAFNVLPDETYEGKNYSVLQVVDTELNYYLDQSSYLLAGMTMPVNDPSFGTDAMILIMFDNYEVHKGVQLANSVTIDVADGMIEIAYAYENTTINEDVDNTLFEKP